MSEVAGLVVVDVSLALKWMLDEPGSGAALILLGEWERARVQPIVPSWFACEAANALLQRVLRNELTVDEAQQSHGALLALVLVLGDEPADAIRALGIAHEFGQKQVYDAQYAALAERLGCDLWTADTRFGTAAHPTLAWIRNLEER